MADSDIDREEPGLRTEEVVQPLRTHLGFDENGYDLSLPYDDRPGPFVISPFNEGTRPRPGQNIAMGL